MRIFIVREIYRLFQKFEMEFKMYCFFEIDKSINKIFKAI